MALGEEPEFLSAELHRNIANAIWAVVEVHERAWSRDGHTERQVRALNIDICRMLYLFSFVFKDVDKVVC